MWLICLFPSGLWPSVTISDHPWSSDLQSVTPSKGSSVPLFCFICLHNSSWKSGYLFNSFLISASLLWKLFLKEKWKHLLVAQWCPALSHPIDCSPPGSSAHGTHQARIVEWVAIPFSRGSSWLRDRTLGSCTVGRFFTIWATREAQALLRQEIYSPLHPEHLQLTLELGIRGAVLWKIYL